MVINTRKRKRFSGRYNTRRGIVSFAISIASLIFLLIGIVISFNKSGNANGIVGIMGTMAFASALAGIITGLRSFKDRDGYYLFSWIGVITNGVMFLIMCGIIIKGIMMF